MEKQFQLLYALKNDSIVHIEEVDRGLKCGCKCPACNEPLIAKKGPKKLHHFAHRPKTNCIHGYETSLHLAAKDIISKAKKLCIPAIYVQFPNSYKNDELICEAKEIAIEKVELEEFLDDIVPDIVVYSNGEKFFVEIFVTHCIDDVKLEKLRKRNIPTMEIDLSKETNTISVEALTNILLNNSEEKQWKYHPLSEEYLKKFISVSENMDITVHGMAQHVNDCPAKIRMWKEKPYANYIDDCLYCKYCISTKDGLLCSGKEAISTVNDFTIPKDERKLKAPAEVQNVVALYNNITNIVDRKVTLEFERTAGFEEVKNRDFEENSPIFDSFEKRWFKCKLCGNPCREDENQMTYRENINKGLCRKCSRALK